MREQPAGRRVGDLSWVKERRRSKPDGLLALEDVQLLSLLVAAFTGWALGLNLGFAGVRRGRDFAVAELQRLKDVLARAEAQLEELWDISFEQPTTPRDEAQRLASFKGGLRPLAGSTVVILGFGARTRLAPSRVQHAEDALHTTLESADIKLVITNFKETLAVKTQAPAR